MTRSRLVLLMLALALTGAACDPADPFGPPDPPVTSDALDVLLGQTSGETAAQRGGGGGNPLFDDLAAEIPGFGGLYRGGQCAVVVVLTAEADREEALLVVHRVLTPLVGRSCAGQLELAAAEGEFTYLKLVAYFEAASPLGGVEGVIDFFIAYQANRLVVQVTTRRVARAVEERLPGLGIPSDAVLFQVLGDG